MGSSMTAYAKAARAKCWTLKAIGERWGIKARQMSYIAANPKPIHWDALAGLPDGGPAARRANDQLTGD